MDTCIQHAQHQHCPHLLVLTTHAAHASCTSSLWISSHVGHKGRHVCFEHSAHGGVVAGRACTQDGYARLPDVTVTDKNDTFHLAGQSFSTFRLMARAMKRDLYGNASPMDTIPVAISGKFVVRAEWVGGGRCALCSTNMGWWGGGCPGSVII